LLLVDGSKIDPVTAAEAVTNVPSTTSGDTATLTVYVRDAPDANGAVSAHVTVLVVGEPTHKEVVWEPGWPEGIKDTPDGKSTSTLGTDALGPLFVTCTVYVAVCPARNGSGAAVALIARSASGFPLIVHVA